MAKKDKNIRFVRIRGKVVPIKVKVQAPPRSIDAQDISTAITNTAVGAGGTYGFFRKISNYFSGKGAKATNMARKFKLNRPKAPGATFITKKTKAGRNVRRKVEPDIFQITDYKNQKAQYLKRKAKLAQMTKTGKQYRILGKFAKKAALPAAIIAGAAMGIASLVDSD